MAGSSPPKDQDIFGKELGLTTAERNVLLGSGEVFLRKVLQVDTYSKKGDPTEPKTLVITNSRCYILSQRPTVKLEVSFNFLKIQLLECTETKLKFQLAGERIREFHSSRRDSVEIIGLITAQLKHVFPITPLEMVLKLTFDPDSLRSDVTSLRDSLLSAMGRGDASSLQGFVTSYAFLCDFFGVGFNDEVSWYLKNIYLAHGFRDLNLSDFNHLSPRDLLPVLSTLRHNEFFEGIVVKNDKLSPELVEELCYVMNVSRAIKKLVLHSASIRPENLMRFSLALKNNPKSALVHLDLSDNALDDKLLVVAMVDDFVTTPAIEALGNALESLPHGLQHLVLANCKITNKGGSVLALSLKQNKHMQYSLVHFDLSGNPLGPDPLGALTFIQEPQTISHLNLSSCGLTLESVVQVLIRGCQQHLATLDLSHNSGKGKKGALSVNVAAKLQQFFSSCIAISNINFTECRLTSEIVSAIIEGLSVNPNVTSTTLNVSSNELGTGRDPQAMAKVISRAQCLHKLDISDCGLDHNLPSIVEAIATNTKLKHVAIGRNFSGKQQIRVAAMDKLCALLKKDDCHLLSLCLQDSKLKELTFTLLTAVSDNTSLLKLNISGNQMGNHGARYLAKVLLTNCHLREVNWDQNDTTMCGLQDVVSALEHNHTLRVMPLPLNDIGRAGKGAEDMVQEVQLRLCRNHSDERLKVELAARHRGRLLTATQHSSVVSRELVQLEDLLQWAESVHGASHDVVKEATEVKNQANKVLKLTDGLYSPQVESDQYEAITSQVKDLLDSFMDQVYSEHIKDTSDRMVEQTLRACPTLLTEEARRTIRGMVLSSSVSSDFTYAKKAVTKKASPEVVSHVSAINLEVAASISELIVNQTLTELDKANLKLMKLYKAARVNSNTPDTKVSRNFTFRVEQGTPPKKKRVRRPDLDDDEEQVDLPGEPLVSEGPALQHLGKTRPKPARMQRGGRSRPNVKPASVQEDSPQEQEPPEERVAVKQTPPESRRPLLPPSTAARTPSPQLPPAEPVRVQTPIEETQTESTKEYVKEPDRTSSTEPSSQEEPQRSTTPKVSPKPAPRKFLSDSTKSEPAEEESKSSSPEVPSVSSPLGDSQPTPPLFTPTPEPTEPSPSPDNPISGDDASHLAEETSPVIDEPDTKKSSTDKEPTAEYKESLDEVPAAVVSQPEDEVLSTEHRQPESSVESKSAEPEDKSPTPPTPIRKPDTPPVEDKESGDEHKDVVQVPPEPKIIVPAKSELPRESIPNDSLPDRKEGVVPKQRTPSPIQTPEDRRESSEGKRTKERKRNALSKIFGGKKSKGENKHAVPDKEEGVEVHKSGDWEVLESIPNKEPPPAAKEKPEVQETKPAKEPLPPVKGKPSPAVREKPAVKPKQRPQPAEQDTPPAGSAESTPIKKLPGGVQMPNVSMDELSSALKRKPKVPPPTPEKPSESSPKPARRTTMEPGPPAPKPRPKPRGTKKFSTPVDTPAKEHGQEQSGTELASAEPHDEPLDTLV